MCRLVCVCGFLERTVLARKIYCRYEMCVNLMQNKIKIESLFRFLHSIRILFLRRPETKEQTRFTIRCELHVCTRMKKKRRTKKKNAQKKQWIAEGEMKKRAAGPRGCVWVLWFKWIFTLFFFHFFGKEEKLRQLSTAKTIVNFMRFIIIVCLACIWFVQYGSLQSLSSSAAATY